MIKKLPVTAPGAFSFSNKTTLLNVYGLNKQDLKVAVIVNDMSEVNIGASMIKRRHTLSKTEKNG